MPTHQIGTVPSEVMVWLQVPFVPSQGAVTT